MTLLGKNGTFQSTFYASYGICKRSYNSRQTVYPPRLLEQQTHNNQKYGFLRLDKANSIRYYVISLVEELISAMVLFRIGEAVKCI